MVKYQDGDGNYLCVIIDGDSRYDCVGFYIHNPEMGQGKSVEMNLNEYEVAALVGQLQSWLTRTAAEGKP